MRELFLQVVSMSLTALWLMLAVMAARLALRRAPKWISVLLWGIAAIRLLCPFSVESPFSLIPEAPAMTAALTGSHISRGESALPANPQGENILPGNTDGNRFLPATGGTHTMPVTDGQAGIRNPESGAPSDKTLPSFPDILAAVWLTGALLLTGYSAYSWLHLKSRVKTAVPLRNHIYISEKISSPFVFGLARPRIYLPYGLDAGSLEYVIAHEKAHIQRKDHWWKLLGMLLLAVHWFNPLVWLSYLLFCRDIELACDERVIRGLDRNQLADYSQALLYCSTSHRGIAACPPAFGEIGVKERVKSILKYKKPAFGGILAAMAVCLVLAFCFLTDPVSHGIPAWAKSLSPEDVQSVRLELQAGSPSLTDELPPERIPSMTALLNEGSGNYVSRPADNRGGSGYFFHIVLQDGTSHTVGNLGNLYLMIDEEYYQAPHEYLSSWEDAFPEFTKLFRSAQNADASGQVTPDGSEPAGSSGQAAPDGSEPAGSSGQTAPDGDEQPAEDTDLFHATILDHVDLDHDGETEHIRVSEEEKGQIYRLEVIRQDGTVIWEREAGPAHMGWTSVFLYQKDGKDYLIEYLPTMYQGTASYSCTMFSLEGGQVTTEDSRTADFSLPVLELTGEMKAFGEMVNYWLKESTVLFSTLEFRLVIGPADPADIPEIYPVVFDSNELIQDDLYPALPESSLPQAVSLYKFVFSSGAGAWDTELTLDADGSFEGVYQDGEAAAGPEYPYGTSYICRFKGRFGQITRLNDYSCSMRLEELTYETETNAEWIEDGVRYIGAEAYGLTEGEEFIFYMPFTPAAELDEIFLSWWPDHILYREGSIQTLYTYAIRNGNTNDGFFASWWN